MKLKNLRQVLNTKEITLFIEHQVPIMFEVFGEGDYLAKGDHLSSEDVMYKKYGEFEIEQIYPKNINCMNIDLVNK